MADRTDKQFTRQDIFFSDFLTNLNRHPSTGSLGLVTNINAVKQAIKNIVLTNYGERLYQPTIGGNIKSSLFNPIDNFSTTLIETSIKNTIFNNDTRVASCKIV
jgi:phage baseplate assembly protein W